jgi:hypothetical protein
MFLCTTIRKAKVATTCESVFKLLPPKMLFSLKSKNDEQNENACFFVRIVFFDFVRLVLAGRENKQKNLMITEQVCFKFLILFLGTLRLMEDDLEDDPNWTPQSQQDLSKLERQWEKNYHKSERQAKLGEQLADLKEFSTQPKSYSIPQELLELVQQGF